MNEATKKFLMGVFVLPPLFGTEHSLDYFVLGMMSAYFYLSTGAVLLISSLIPGDNIFRFIEAAAGILCCLRGYKGFHACMELGIAMYGIALSGTIQKLIPGNLADVLQVGLKLMSSQPAEHKATPNPSETQQARAVASGAAQETSKKTP
jgi:hypothetical protein